MASDKQDKFEEMIKKSELAHDLMVFLEIPMTDYNYVHKMDFYDLIMNKEKCQKLISKLKNKAFW